MLQSRVPELSVVALKLNTFDTFGKNVEVI